MQGATIRQKLSQLSIPPAEVARLLDITAQAVAGIFASADVRTSTVERLCEVLHLPITFFFGADDEDALTTLAELKASRVEKIWRTNNIGDKVRQLLREQKKRFVGLCDYVGMSDPGLRKVFERDTCNINTLTKIAEYFCVPITYFLPEDQHAQEESEKDREIEHLRGQVEAYKTALQLVARGSDAGALLAVAK